MRALIILALLFVSGCGTTDLLRVEKRVQAIERFHPPLPSPVRPISPKIVVITPDTAGQMSEEVTAGERPVFVYMAMSEQDYLTLSQWLQESIRYVDQLNAIVDYYRVDTIE